MCFSNSTLRPFSRHSRAPLGPPRSAAPRRPLPPGGSGRGRPRLHPAKGRWPRPSPPRVASRRGRRVVPSSARNRRRQPAGEWVTRPGAAGSFPPEVLPHRSAMLPGPPPRSRPAPCSRRAARPRRDAAARWGVRPWGEAGVGVGPRGERRERPRTEAGAMAAGGSSASRRPAGGRFLR